MNQQRKLGSERGLSIIEFMVGIAVGLLILVGATKLFSDYIVSNKRLLLETRVNQDLRAAADIVARDVRRAGYWENSLSGVWGTGSVATTPNPHATGAGLVSATSTSVSYSYARNADDVLDNNERAGFRVLAVNGVNTLQMQDGLNNWQAVTDPGTLRVTAFSVTAASPVLSNDLSKYCGCLARLTCTMADLANPATNPAGAPTLTIPSYQIVLTGEAVNDPSVTRTINEAVRVRNPIISGACLP